MLVEPRLLVIHTFLVLLLFALWLRDPKTSHCLFHPLALYEPRANILLGALVGSNVPGANLDADIAGAGVLGSAVVQDLLQRDLLGGERRLAWGTQIRECAWYLGLKVVDRGSRSMRGAH